MYSIHSSFMHGELVEEAAADEEFKFKVRDCGAEAEGIGTGGEDKKDVGRVVAVGRVEPLVRTKDVTGAVNEL